MTNSLVLTQEQGAALMQWPFLSVVAPEFADLQVQLKEASTALSAKVSAKGGCPKCVREQYRRWGRDWLAHLNIRINSSPDTLAVVQDFLATQMATR